jgi:hypothetical protein
VRIDRGGRGAHGGDVCKQVGVEDDDDEAAAAGEDFPEGLAGGADDADELADGGTGDGGGDEALARTTSRLLGWERISRRPRRR